MQGRHRRRRSGRASGLRLAIRQDGVRRGRANAFTASGDDDNATGYQAGLGFERKIGDNFSVGLDYLYSTLKNEGARVRTSRGTGPATNAFVLVNPNGTDFRRGDDDFDFNNFRLTASYRV